MTRVGPPDPTRSLVEVNKTTALADNGDLVRVTVTLHDASGALVTNHRVRVSVSGGGNTFEPEGTTDGSGRFETAVRSSVAQKKTVSVTAADGIALGMRPEVTFLPGPAAVVAFRVQPSTTRVGEPIRPPVELSVTDAQGNAVPSSDVTFSVRLVRSSGGVVTGGAARPVVDGGVVFDALTIDRAQTGYALRAEGSNGAAAESVRFDVQ